MSFHKVNSSLWHCSIKEFEAYGHSLKDAMTKVWAKYQKHRELLAAR